MFHFSILVHNPQPHILFSPFPIFPSSSTPRKFQSLQTLKFPKKWNFRSFSPSLYPAHQDDDSEEHVIGDCVVFEEGIFEDLISDNNLGANKPKPNSKKKKKMAVIEAENLIPDKWREVQAEVNITKKERRKIAQEIEFNSKVMKKKRGLVPLRDMNLDDYKAYKEARLAQLKPWVLDRPPSFSFAEKEEDSEGELSDGSGGGRVEPKNPRWAVYGRGLEVQAEVNITKKERRKIAQEIEFNSKVKKKKRGLVPLRDMNLDDYKAYKEARLAQLKPLVLDRPPSFSFAEKEEDSEGELSDGSGGERVEPKNPRWAVYGRGLEDVAEFFNSEKYDPAAKSTEGRPKLFTREEKALLCKQKPDLAVATSDKWLPLHTLAASGEFFLLDSLLKHDVDINAMDKDGLTALHKAIIGKKHSITNYLLRNSANPFVQDNDGASLMHYAVQTASVPTIKVLLLYNVDINLQDNDGWTPLHLAVQTQRTDIVKLLLIKGADKTLKNKDGLTPLDLCLYSGQSVRTYELIKLLKQPQRRARRSVRQMGG